MQEAAKDIWGASGGMENERSYVLKADEVARLREASGLSLEALADRAEVHVKTLRRWLKGSPAFIHNVAALAKALRTTPDKLIQRQAEEVALVIPAAKSEERPRKRVTVTIATINFDGFDDAEQADLVKMVAERIGATGEIIVAKVERGSVIVTLEMNDRDYAAFLSAVAKGELTNLGITRVQDAETGEDLKVDLPLSTELPPEPPAASSESPTEPPEVVPELDADLWDLYYGHDILQFEDLLKEAETRPSPERERRIAAINTALKAGLDRYRTPD